MHNGEEKRKKKLNGPPVEICFRHNYNQEMSPEECRKELRYLFEQSAVGIAYVGRDGRLVRTNRKFRDIMGYDEEEMTGTDVGEIKCVKDGRDEPFCIYNDLVTEEASDRSVEYLVRRKDGSSAWVVFTISSARDDSPAAYRVITAQDVSGAKLAEKALRESRLHYKNLWDDAPVAYHMVDTEGKITRVNRTELKILGYEAEEMTGKHFFDFILPDQRPVAEKRFRLKIAGNRVRETENITYVRKNGTAITFSVNDALERDIDGEVVGIRSTMADITRQRLADDKVRRASETQAALNGLLKVSFKNFSLKETLLEIIDRLIAVRWANLEPKIGIWVADENSKYLKLSAYRGLPRVIIKKHRMISLDRPLPETTLADDNRRGSAAEILGDYRRSPEPFLGGLCIPIMSKNKLLGFLNLHTKDREGGRDRNNENFFLSVASVLANVIENRRIQWALKESEEKYRSLVNNAGDAVIVLNTEGKIIFANKAFERLSGYKEEIPGLHVSGFIHKDSMSCISGCLCRLLSGKKSIANQVCRAVNKNGKSLYVGFGITSIAKNGKITGFQIIARDITELKELQDRIEEDKIYYEQVINTISDGICVVDRNHKIISCNKKFKEKIGLEEKRIEGCECGEIFPLYAKGVFAKYCSGRCRNGCVITKALQSGRTNSHILRSKEKEGEEYYHKVLAFAVKGAAGDIGQVVLAVRDITSSKSAEEKISRLHEFSQRILDNAPISIVVLNKKNEIISANKPARKLMNKEGKYLIGTRLIDNEEIRSDKVLAGKYRDLFKENKPFFHNSLSYKTGNAGEIKHLNVIAVPLLDRKGCVEGAISMALDNTEAIKAEQKLAALNQDLENKVQERTEELGLINEKLSRILDSQSKFIANASHELRTPLTIIQGNLELAVMEEKSGGKNRPDPEFFDIMLAETENMAGLLTDLTILTNIDSQSERLAFSRVKVNDLVEGVCRSLQVLASGKNIDLSFSAPGDDCEIWGDETKLERLLLNIVRNGIKYTEAGGWVKVEVSDKNREELRIIVRDCGIGIPEHELPHIFERFYRVDKSRSRNEGGTGLGLSIAKWIAEAHGGRIGVKSSPGRGTSFIIDLPREYRLRGGKKTSLYFIE